MTPFHRTPAGVEGARLVRPALVLADPDLMASAPPATLAATAMNALAHAMEALYTPLANPVTSMAALRAASLLAGDDREGLALGAVLAGYASGATGIAVHHAICQTIVRTAGTPHAETNAVMLPHSARLMEPRAPEAMAEFKQAVGTDLAGLAARSGHTRLATLGVEEQQLADMAEAVGAHPLLGNTPQPPGTEELLATLREAL
jgi:alcohol dehydrogenase class IV